MLFYFQVTFRLAMAVVSAKAGSLSKGDGNGNENVTWE